jgi:hypothetical protein
MVWSGPARGTIKVMVHTRQVVVMHIGRHGWRVRCGQSLLLGDIVTYPPLDRFHIVDHYFVRPMDQYL